jgi:hypothetical protein
MHLVCEPVCKMGPREKGYTLGQEGNSESVG